MEHYINEGSPERDINIYDVGIKREPFDHSLLYDYLNPQRYCNSQPVQADSGSGITAAQPSLEEMYAHATVPRRCVALETIYAGNHCDLRDQIDLARQGQRQDFYRKQVSLWNTAECAGSLYSGAWTAKHFAGKIASVEKPPKGFTRNTGRGRSIGGSFSVILGATALEYGIDQVILPGDQKMEATVVSDWAISPAVSISPIRWPFKLLAILSIHAVGRLVDHCRQPAQDF
jgi:hypothetical protein